MDEARTHPEAGLPSRARRAEGALRTAAHRPSLRFWALVLGTGALSGVGAALLLLVLRAVQRVAWGTADEGFLEAILQAGPWRRVLIPALAGVLVALGTWLSGRPLRGHGTASIIESIWTRSGRLALGPTLARGLVSIVGVGLGTPLGREGALLQMGAATGSALGQRAWLTPDQVRLLVACGASAGMAAAYNVPIGGALFGLEVLLGSLALELFGPIVLACVAGTLVSRLLVGNHPGYAIPHYELGTLGDLGLTAVCAVVVGAASALYVRVVESFSVVGEQLQARWRWLLPVGVMLLVGTAAVRFPELLGNGYDSVNLALRNQLPLVLLLALPLLKMVASALCAGGGVPGGLFTPSLFFGALLGGGLGALAHALWPTAAMAPAGAFALLGMAAVLAGTTHAPVCAVLLVFEMTDNYTLILPLMLTAVVAAGVSRRLVPRSLYSSVLWRRRVPVPGAASPNWLRSHSVASLLSTSALTVAPSAPFAEVAARLLEAPAGASLQVVQGNRHLLGTITLDAIKGQLPDYTQLHHTRAEDLVDRRVQPVERHASLAEAVLRFRTVPFEQLPVVDGNGRLVGTLSKGELLRHARF